MIQVYVGGSLHFQLKLGLPQVKQNRKLCEYVGITILWSTRIFRQISSFKIILFPFPLQVCVWSMHHFRLQNGLFENSGF